jgi:hypothetical protein
MGIDDIKIIIKILRNDDFINFLKINGSKKSGGYFSLSSKVLEKYLNFRIGELYENN